MTSLAPLFRELMQHYQTMTGKRMLETDVPGVHFFWNPETVPREPLLYKAGIVIIGQGHKLGYLGHRTFRYDGDTYLVLGVPLPFECEAFGTPEEPLIGLRIDIDLAKLHELVARVSGRLPHIQGEEASADTQTGLEPVQIDDSMREAIWHLLKCLRDPVDSKVLGPAAVDEIIYRTLRGEKGRVLYDLTQHLTPYAAVARALERIHANYRAPLTIDELARESAMSVSSFHRVFKRVTGDSPLQYIKKIRLDKAKGLLVHSGMRVSNVAYEVGYESPSQFSREFKRYFKVPPSEANNLAYA